MYSPLLKMFVVLCLAIVPDQAVALDPAGALGGAAGGIGGALGGTVDGAAGAVGGAMGAVGSAVGGPLGGAAGSVGSAVGSIGTSVGEAAGMTGGALGSAGGAVGGARGAGGTGRGSTNSSGGSGSTGSAGRGAVGSSGSESAFGAVGSVSHTAVGPSPVGDAVGASGRSSNATSPGGSAALTAAPALERQRTLTWEGPPPVMMLPLVLIPDRSGGDVERVFPRLGAVRGSERDLRQLRRRLSPMAGVPRRSVDACRNTIAAQVTPYGGIQVEAVSAGPPRGIRQRGTNAPIEARIIYARADHVQVRQARITCRLDAQGRVVALL
jgi:hypothetical protein